MNGSASGNPIRPSESGSFVTAKTCQPTTTICASRATVVVLYARIRRRKFGYRNAAYGSCLIWRYSNWRDGRPIELAGADAINILDWQNEYFSVADIAGARSIDDGIHGRLDEMIRDADLDPHFVGELHLHRRAAVGFDALDLAAVTLNAADREPRDFRAEKRFEDVVQTLRPNNCDNEFHSAPLIRRFAAPSARCAGRRISM